MNQELSSIIDQVSDHDQRYKQDAYYFVMEALSFTQRKFKSASHVTSDEILYGMRELLLIKFGPMTMMVLKYWGIHATEDFGNIIFSLVENKVLSKTEEDDISKFRNGYDFNEVFIKGYRKRLHKKISRMRSI